MRSIDVKKVGAIAAGAAMIGASLAMPVLAGMDTTGFSKDFFYDENYVPKVQIVVGEKVGDALDFVTAGNIAATIGNLAYKEETVTVGGEATIKGKVIITSIGRSAIGDYVQDTDATLTSDFYDETVGLHFDGEKTYEKGDFTKYIIGCEGAEQESVALLKSGEYTNIHCLFCQTLCLEALENPSHEMSEKIIIDNSKIRYYEDGLDSSESEYLEMAIEEGAITYVVDTGYIPVSRKLIENVANPTSDNWVDFEWRGKIIFLGEEYFVKSISKKEVVIAKGALLTDITSEGYTSEYQGYKFKIDHLIYSGDYEVAGILLTIQKPDGTEVQRQISKMANGIVDNLEIAGVYAEAAGGVETASIIVYDLTTEITLEDGENLQIGDKVYDEWVVDLGTVECTPDSDCADEISEYGNLHPDYDTVLKNITLRLAEDIDEEPDGDFPALRVGDSFDFPLGGFKLTFRGYMTSNFEDKECSGGTNGIRLYRGDEDYQVVLELTAEDGNHYNVRLDNGPFDVSDEEDAFMINGKLYQYTGYEFNEGDTKGEDTIEITLKPALSGTKTKITLNRFCDPQNDTLGTECRVGGKPTCSCDSLPDDFELRGLALLDAYEDECDDFKNDKEIELKTSKLFWGTATVNNVDLVILYDDSSHSIAIFKKGSGNNQTTVFEKIDSEGRPLVFVDEDIVTPVEKDPTAVFTDFDEDGYGLKFWVQNEIDYSSGVPSCGTQWDKVGGADINDDHDKEDTLFFFLNDDNEMVMIDLSDRDDGDGGAGDDDDYQNSLGIYQIVCNPSVDHCTYNASTGTWDCTNVTFDGCTLSGDSANYTTNVIQVVDDDKDSLLITPMGDDEYTVSWWTNNAIDSVSVCHPTKEVDATYFFGTEEKEEEVKAEITEEDVGKTVTAACCTFKVGNFTVTGTTEKVEYKKVTVQPVGNLVVSESEADPNKNLIIVGGPVVNGMAEGLVTLEEVQGQPDRFVVKKVDNKIIVAGLEADDTRAAGDALISWLKANIHA